MNTAPLQVSHSGMKQLRPIPSQMTLAPTLAQRVNQLRDFRNMTVKDVARAARFTVKRVEDIESGIETWLSSSDRQLLARALSVDPALLQEVEERVIAGHQVRESHMFNQATNRQLCESILDGLRELECPDCGGTLKCSIQEGIDIEGRPILFPKAFCMKCPFTLR
jgi:transcriptional regulator with XRE-family HTH domain